MSQSIRTAASYVVRRITWASMLSALLLTAGSGWAQEVGKAERPRLVIQSGHAETVNLAVSKDGKSLLTGSYDRTLKLWDVASGKLLRTFSGHSTRVTAVAFSLDNKTALSGDTDSTIKLWDLATGLEILTFSDRAGSVIKSSTSIDGKTTDEQFGPVESITVSPDGETVLSKAGFKTFKLWKLATGRELRPFDTSTCAVAFSPTGLTVITGGCDGTLKILNVASGEELATFSGHAWQAPDRSAAGFGLFEPDKAVESVAFSPDGRTVLSKAGDTLKLWDVKTGKELPTFTGHTRSAVVFSENGRTILSDAFQQWDVATGKVLRAPLRSEESKSVAFAPNRKTMFTGYVDGSVKLWSVETDQVLRTFDKRNGGLTSLAVCKNGKSAVSASLGQALFHWEMAEPREMRLIRTGDITPFSAALSPDCKTVLLGGVVDPEFEWGKATAGLIPPRESSPAEQRSKNLALFDVVSGEKLLSFDGPIEGVSSVAFSPDPKTKTALTGGGDNTARLWDIVTGEELPPFGRSEAPVSTVAFSPDGKTILSGGDMDLRLWDVATRVERPQFGRHGNWLGLNHAVFSPTDKTVLAGSVHNTLKLWDVVTGIELRTFRGHSQSVNSVAFTPDGEKALSGSSDNTLKLWDVATGLELCTFSGHMDQVTAVAFLSGGKIGLSGSLDQTLKLWDVATGRLLATLASFYDGTWAVIDPDGRFDASNGGDNPHLHWVFENTPIDLSQLKDRYYDPGLLQKVMGYSQERLRTVPAFEDAVLKHWPGVTASLDEQHPLRLKIQLSDRGDGYGPVRVRVNGKEVTADARAGQILTGNQVELTVDLDPERLLFGENRVDVVAWPAAGHIPSPAAAVTLSGAVARGEVETAGTTKTSQDEPVTLHAIVMGVGQYAGPNLRLAFAAKDADDFGKALELGGARLFGADRVRLHRYSDYAKSGAVPSERLPRRNHLQQAFEAIAKEAKAGDILVVYLSGHGVMTPGAAGEAEYYYLTRDAQSTDLSDPVVRKLWGISSSELREWIKAIKANKQVLILDTCAAGGAIERLVTTRQIPGAQLIALEQLKDRAGVHILAGAAADKVSYEASRYGQGLLTYALLEGMKGAKLVNGNVDVQQLFQHARDRVPLLARQIGGIQKPRLSSPQGESFVIGRMDNDDLERVPLAQIKPVILRANFQDEEVMRDKLRLGQRFADQLQLETYAVGRGRLVFVDAEDFPDAWQISGRYRKETGGWCLRAHLFRGEEDKGSFEVLLPLDEAAQTDALLDATLKAMGQ